MRVCLFALVYDINETLWLWRYCNLYHIHVFGAHSTCLSRPACVCTAKCTRLTNIVICDWYIHFFSMALFHHCWREGSLYFRTYHGSIRHSAASIRSVYWVSNVNSTHPIEISESNIELVICCDSVYVSYWLSLSEQWAATAPTSALPVTIFLLNWMRIERCVHITFKAHKCARLSSFILCISIQAKQN